MTDWPRPTPHSFDPDEFGYCGVCGFNAHEPIHAENVNTLAAAFEADLEAEARAFAEYEKAVDENIAQRPFVPWRDYVRRNG